MPVRENQPGRAGLLGGGSWIRTLGPPSDGSMQTPGIAADRDTGGADWRGIDENGSNGLSGVSSVNARRSARGWEAGGELGEIGARPYYHQSHKNAVSPQTVS